MMRNRFPTTRLIATSLIVGSLALAAVTVQSKGARFVHVPAAPRDVRVMVDPGAIEVFFRSPISNGGDRIRNYRVNVLPNGPRHYCFSSGCAIPFTGTGLARVEVTAVNAVGLGATSSPSRAFTTQWSPSHSSPRTPRSNFDANWAGYAVTKGHFTSASARFVVPRVTCTGPTSELTQWVGIDGYGSNTVEQDGISVTCANGSPSYFAFYEMWGDLEANDGNPVRLLGTVRPGDLISASVRASNNEWSFLVTDLTSRWHFKTSVTSPSPAPQRVSAEFILEDSAFSCNVGFPCVNDTLPSFTDAAFSNISFVENGHVTSAIPSRPNTYALTVVQSGRCLVVPSRLPRNGASFSVSTPAQPLVALHEHFDPVTSPSTESPWRTRSTCN